MALPSLGHGVMVLAIILETERLLFRHHKPEDIEPYCAMQVDPEVRRYVGGHPRTREEAEERFHRVCRESASPSRLQLWATVYKPDGCYCGYCGIYPHFLQSGDTIPGEGVIAFYLARTYWSRGLATEAGRAFIRFGFEDLGLHRISACVQVGNDASMRVMTKLGLLPIGDEQTGSRSFRNFEITRPHWPDSRRSDMHRPE